MRHGPRKLLADAKLEQFALYNLVEDPGETRDRREDQPERFKELRAELERLYVLEGKPYAID